MKNEKIVIPGVNIKYLDMRNILCTILFNWCKHRNDFICEHCILHSVENFKKGLQENSEFKKTLVEKIKDFLKEVEAWQRKNGKVYFWLDSLKWGDENENSKI